MTNDDVHLLAEKLADDCTKAGLVAEVLAPTRVRVGAPGRHARLTETVCCMPLPHGDESLMWWWSWGEPISPAAHIPDAVRVISRVLSPPAAEDAVATRAAGSGRTAQRQSYDRVSPPRF